MNTLSVIDTFGFFFRSFYALPPLKNKEGFPTGLLVGFCNLLQSLYKDPSCTYVAFALEGGGENKRRQIYDAYKRNRQNPPQELLMQLPIAIDWIEKMGFLNISIEGYEADDVIASINRVANAQNIVVRIISHDKDLYQLIDENTYIYDPIGKKDIREAECLHKYGVRPQNFIDYQSLVGDTSDNIVGIKGIGAKSAQKLIAHFGTLESLYERESELEEVVTPRIAHLLREGKENAFLSKKLVTLYDDLLQSIDLSKCLMPQSNPMLKILDELREYDLKNIISKVQSPHERYAQRKSAQKGIGSLNDAPDVKQYALSTQNFHFKAHLLDNVADLESVLDSIPSSAKIGFDCESDSLNMQEAHLVGFSFCFDGENAYYVPVGHSYLGVGNQLSLEQARTALKRIFAYPLIGHNLKFDLSLIFRTLGLEHTGTIYDSMILGWLYDSIAPVGLDKQMLKWFNHTMISFDSVVAKDENFSQVNIAAATQYAAEDAIATFRLYHRLEEVFYKRELSSILELASSLEYPFIKVLLAMECEGIKVDIALLESLKEKASEHIAQLSAQIFELCGETFNLNSPQQLAHILFNRLGLKAGRSVKGGLSTDERTLLAITDTHPVIALILDYREVNKLKSTYIEPLLRFGSANTEHRIYTSFLQSGTATGRLSSKSPNLQNIPVRSDEGRKIRQAFISKEGHSLISIDYSQIELRLLAHFCKDSSLIEAFIQDKDIHFETAARLFGEECAAQKRAIAKSINFGLIYGMGSKKLAQTLQISLKEAKNYIESYFALFPTIKNFLNAQKEFLLENGYSQTLLGHRRYFDFKNATDFMRANFLREGINSIFQGSAADLIKLSMCEIHRRYEKSDFKMLLQVHDELIFEAPQEKAHIYAQEAAQIMNHIYTLEVPLKCGISIGKNWAELK
ncbi:DNA polymerase I [Helicobacter sp. MIT 21-1697]|uniref:DNA polymerase I n=1 Tax=Helicobacter sp. MIT 21-1697 TaxID=2993733 RepID=UPI00224B64E5|nr:DNA polymerase I [Helicobacter sp. MIT 21-1697]MCX2717208.1 DNA polymerase I [Helicobacter sp. MIT 21-1697]